MFVDDPKVHEAVRRKIFRTKTLQRQLEPDPLLGEALQRFQQRRVRVEFAALEGRRESRRTLGERLKTMADFLRHGLHQSSGLFFQQPRNQPFATVRGRLVEHRQGHGERDPVIGFARFVAIFEPEFLAENFERGLREFALCIMRGRPRAA